MSTRTGRTRTTDLTEILKLLGDPAKVGVNQVWVGRDYSLQDLILDLRSANELLTNQQKL